jgi:hypothetical protein
MPCTILVLFIALAERIRKHLLSRSRHMFMHTVDSLPAGLVRLNVTANTTTLNLVLGNYFHGLGAYRCTMPTHCELTHEKFTSTTQHSYSERWERYFHRWVTARRMSSGPTAKSLPPFRPTRRCSTLSFYAVYCNLFKPLVKFHHF